MKLGTDNWYLVNQDDKALDYFDKDRTPMSEHSFNLTVNGDGKEYQSDASIKGFLEVIAQANLAESVYIRAHMDDLIVKMKDAHSLLGLIGVETPEESVQLSFFEDVNAQKATVPTITCDWSEREASEEEQELSKNGVTYNTETEKTVGSDINALSSIESRKSVLNFTQDELNATSSWATRFREDIDKKSPFFRAENGEWRDTSSAPVHITDVKDKSVDFRTTREDIKSRSILRGNVVNTDTGWEIQVSRTGLEDTVSYGVKTNDDIVYKALYQIDELVKNSILLDSTTSDKNNKNKAYNSAFMHKAYGVFKINSEPFIAKLAIEEFASGNNGTLKRLYNLQDIKIEPLKNIEFMGKPLAHSFLNGSDISVAQLFSLVKTYDKDFYLNKRNDKEHELSQNGVTYNTETQKQAKRNFAISDEKLGEAGNKAKFRANIDAIKLLKELEEEKRFANPDEQKTLSGYVGWGGLPQAFDENNGEWTSEFVELKSLLSDTEYESARASTLNAHYTSPTVISAIYDGLENLGFKSGNVLEPAMGVGNFFGAMPASMRSSSLYGVEFDSVSGRIAKQLYQKADIQVTGFEKTAFQDNFFDVVVGNVPFGSYKLAEKQYDKLNLFIHDHFFAKSLDKVRPGGVIAFVTSKGTLDKANPQFRKYLAQRAELLGAIRLPNNAFKANAGTEVTSDIIFLQKRDKIIDIEPDWINLGKTYNGVPVNKYFEQHPEMILGEMKQGVEFSMYGNPNETSCVPLEGADLKEQLRAAVSHISGEIPEAVISETAEKEKKTESIPAEPDTKNYSYTVKDDKLYYRENSRMYEQNISKEAEKRIRAAITIRDSVRDVMSKQLNDYPEAEIKSAQEKLNLVYDDFVAKYGRLNDKTNITPLKKEISTPLLLSLETLKDGNFFEKAAIFSKRTINPRRTVENIETSNEALSVSLAEKARIDMPFMQKLTGKSENEILEDLNGVIYVNPAALPDGDDKYLSADEYLSGNIREKLTLAKASAEQHPEIFSVNVTALEQAMPEKLEASDINVRLGATWIEPQIVKRFISETLQVPRYWERSYDVKFSPYTAEWNIQNKGIATSYVLAVTAFGTPRKNAFEIIEDSLNLRDSKVYDRVEMPDGKMSSVVNHKETELAQQKQAAIKEAFQNWIFNDPERREKLVNKYNVLFNSTKPRQFDGSHMDFPGINPEIILRKHQKDAIAHGLACNTLFAHEVGAGKTFEIIATAMEGKRLGLHSKSLIAVPNHLTEQMGRDFLQLYPAANILVATEADFEKKNRQKLCAKIATGEFDAVIVGHSQLIKIPISQERQERLIREQISDIAVGISELKRNSGEQFSVKQLEKTKKALETKLAKLTSGTKRDDVVTFEELGIDKMFIDEADTFKNLFLATKMRNVSGISTNDNVQKTQDLYMKCQYLDEITGGRGIVFATGTPVSNSMTEIYSMQKYLQSSLLEQHNLKHFDSWASTFGETVTASELAPEGTGYRSKTRFAKFYNLPELMNLFKECADIKTADTLNLSTPQCKIHNISVEPTETQSELVQRLSERAKDVHDKKVPPEEDNMLKITTDGRKIGLDQRLINPLLPDEPGTKVNACVDNVYKIWDDTKSDRLTQLVFCDFSTPKSDGSFNLYDDLSVKLVAKGVPKEEIAFIHEAKNPKQKEEMFEKVRTGAIRVLIGSTSKMGAGTNVQDRLVASHDLDCPWKPRDMEQRRGRMVRQGNKNTEVDLYRYVTKKTFDAYLFQTLENKQKFIGQIMTSKAPVRSCEDVDEAALSYAEVKALCAGDPRIKEKMELDIDVAKLKMLKASHKNQQYRLEDQVLRDFPRRISQKTETLKHIETDEALAKMYPEQKDKDGKSIMYPMTVFGKTYTDKEAAGEAILKACTQVVGGRTDMVEVGDYKGFKMLLTFDQQQAEHALALKNAAITKTHLGISATGCITRIENALDNLSKQLEYCTNDLTDVKQQMENAKIEMQKEFPQEQELVSKQARLEELTSILDLGAKETEQKAIKRATL